MLKDNDSDNDEIKNFIEFQKETINEMNEETKKLSKMLKDEEMFRVSLEADIPEIIQKKQLNLDKHVDDCYANAIMEAVELGSDLGYYVDNGNITNDEYINYIHELKESIKLFAHKCVCFQGSIDGETFP